MKIIKPVTVVLIAAILGLGIWFGLVQFNLPTIENLIKKYPTATADGELLAHVENGIEIRLSEKTYLNDLCLNGSVKDLPKTVCVYYTETAEEPFSERKRLDAVVTTKNSDVLLTVEKEAVAVRVELPEGAEVSSVLINPRRPHIRIYAVVGCTVFAALCGLLLSFRFSFKAYFQKFKRYFPLVQNLVSRDLKVKYRRSVLGYLWSVLNPLLMARVIHAVFSRMFRFNIPYYATYYLVGAQIFNFVIDCTSTGVMSVIDAAPLIKKVYIPKYIFPMQKCAFAFVNMLFSIVAVLVVMLIQRVPFHWTILFFFLPMLYALVFAYGMGLILSSLAVFFRDTQYLYMVFTQIWMYLTPIFYPEEVLLNSKLSFILKINPLYYYTHMLRGMVINGSMPSLNEHVMGISFAMLALIFGILIFRRLQDRFILYV